MEAVHVIDINLTRGVVPKQVHHQPNGGFKLRTESVQATRHMKVQFSEAI